MLVSEELTSAGTRGRGSGGVSCARSQGSLTVAEGWLRTGRSGRRTQLVCRRGDTAVGTIRVPTELGSVGAVGGKVEPRGKGGVSMCLQACLNQVWKDRRTWKGRSCRKFLLPGPKEERAGTGSEGIVWARAFVVVPARRQAGRAGPGSAGWNNFSRFGDTGAVSSYLPPGPGASRAAES